MYMSQIVKLKMLNVKLRWQEVNDLPYADLIYILIFCSSHRALILLPNVEAACALIINEMFGNPPCINLVIFEGVLCDLMCRTVNAPVSPLLNR